MNLENVIQLDLNFQNVPKSISAFVINSDDGPILFECGPASSLENLKADLAKHGIQIQDIKHLFITHIHLDHAGASWYFAQHGAQVYLHPLGQRHMINPDKLISSATLIYGNHMERLWGDIKPIETKQLVVVEDNQKISIGNKIIQAIYTPGHAQHHVAWKVGDVLFTGDVAGVRINGGPAIPPCPPPDVHIESWYESLDRIENLRDLKVFYLTHGGEVRDLKNHMSDLRQRLSKYSKFIYHQIQKNKSIESSLIDFEKYVIDELNQSGQNDDKEIEVIKMANPIFMSVMGLYRYWNKKLE